MTPAWWYISNNFGDNLNHYLIGAITGKPVIYTQRNRPHNIVCGSILHEANEWSTIWGAGFGNEGQRVNTRYAKIKMVRGWLSADIVDNKSPLCEFSCAAGDPALLLPKYYRPKNVNGDRIGVIPHYDQYGSLITAIQPNNHYGDAHPLLFKFGQAYDNNPNILIIDPFLPVKEFIDAVCSCTRIVSSSLHGLIVADAYGVPNSWLGYGDEFKYRDYYSTTKQPKEPIFEVSWDECFVSEYKYDYDYMLNCCPFINK